MTASLCLLKLCTSLCAMITVAQIIHIFFKFMFVIFTRPNLTEVYKYLAGMFAYCG